MAIYFEHPRSIRDDSVVLCNTMFLLLAFVALVRAQLSLPLGSLSSFAAPTSLLALPASPQLTVSVAICTSQAASARFFLSNSTSGAVPGPGGGADVFEIQLGGGIGQWSGSAPGGGLLAVQDLNEGSFQISVSDNGIPEHCLGVPTTNRFGHPRHDVPGPRSAPPARGYHLQPGNSLFASLFTCAERTTQLSKLYSPAS